MYVSMYAFKCIDLVHIITEKALEHHCGRKYARGSEVLRGESGGSHLGSVLVTFLLL